MATLTLKDAPKLGPAFEALLATCLQEADTHYHIQGRRLLSNLATTGRYANHECVRTVVAEARSEDEAVRKAATERLDNAARHLLCLTAGIPNARPLGDQFGHAFTLYQMATMELYEGFVRKLTKVVGRTYAKTFALLCIRDYFEKSHAAFYNRPSSPDILIAASPNAPPADAPLFKHPADVFAKQKSVKPKKKKRSKKPHQLAQAPGTAADRAAAGPEKGKGIEAPVSEAMDASGAPAAESAPVPVSGNPANNQAASSSAPVASNDLGTGTLNQLLSSTHTLTDAAEKVARLRQEMFHDDFLTAVTAARQVLQNYGQGGAQA